MWSSTSYDGQGFWLATKRLSKGRFRWWPTGDEPARVLRRFIAENSHLSRRKLSAKVCEAWDWRQPNGALRDMVCRGLLLMLHRAGEVQLPDVRFVPRNPFVDRGRGPFPSPNCRASMRTIQPMRPSATGITGLRRAVFSEAQRIHRARYAKAPSGITAYLDRC